MLPAPAGRVEITIPTTIGIVYARYHETLKRIGVRDLPPYSCRHSTATALAMQNIAPSIIQKVMRHAKFSTTQSYIHVDVSPMLEAVNRLAELQKKDKKELCPIRAPIRPEKREANAYATGYATGSHFS